jgi:Ca-activated chloride channel family protein
MRPRFLAFLVLPVWASLAVGLGPYAAAAPPSTASRAPAQAGGFPAQPEPIPPSSWGLAPAASNGPAAVYTDPGELPRLRTADGELPLEHTHVSARLSAFVADVEVSQTYRNPGTRSTEAVYTFPLPENSAVDRMRMTIGDRTIEAAIREREQAKREYEAAKHAGHTAALLEQERVNIFTQSVANIAPASKIDVTVHYVQDLTYDAGQVEFVFPMVVGPRYLPEGRVPDAARISPPYMGKGDRSGRDISLDLVADVTGTIGDFEVPAHDVMSRRPADGTLRMTLAEKDTIPNRDFVLRFRVAGARPGATLYTSGGDDGYFALVVQPPLLDVDALVGRREMIFVVDVSGSMSGVPLGMCKTAMREALSRLRPVDTFDIITFSGRAAKLWPEPRAASDVAVREALQFVSSLTAGGGTELGDAVAAALTPDVPAGRDRYVFFMTDGFVGDDQRIVAMSRRFAQSLTDRGQRARVFGFGTGSSVNRALIDGLSRAGNGVPVYATTREDPRRDVERFFRFADRSVLRDVHIDWGDLRVNDVAPGDTPDLYASHRLVVHGRYSGAAAGKPVVVRGTAGDQIVEIAATSRVVPNSAAAAPHDLLGELWARSRVGELEDSLWMGDVDARGAITKLGIDFGIVTPFTSFIAVDSSRVVGDGDPDTIVQPQEGPEAVDLGMARGTLLPAPQEPMRELVEQVAPGASSRGCVCDAAAGVDPGRGGAWAVGALGLALLCARRRR